MIWIATATVWTLKVAYWFDEPRVKLMISFCRAIAPVARSTATTASLVSSPSSFVRLRATKMLRRRHWLSRRSSSPACRGGVLAGGRGAVPRDVGVSELVPA